MKILLLTDGIAPFVIGGMQKHSFYLAKYLALNGVDVDLYHCVKNGATKIEHNQVLQEMQLPADAKLTSKCFNFPRLAQFPGHYLKESFNYSLQLFQDYTDQLSSYDFIYAKGFAAWYLLDQKSKNKIKNCPPIGVKFHGYEMFQPAPDFKTKLQHYLLRGPVKNNNRKADFVFSYGGKITPLIKSIGVDADKIVEIPSGIEAKWCVEKPAQSGAKKNFLFVGRYERRKGVEELNNVLQTLIETEDFHFNFVGPIPSSQKIKSSKITYHGKVMDAEKMRHIVTGCDILVTPSHSEGMPNVILEGMAGGLAVISTDVGAIADMVGEDNGWLLPPANENALLKAMEEAIIIPEDLLTQKKQKSIDKISEKFTWEEVAKVSIEKIRATQRHR